jgi:hypothetical protein
MNTFNTFRLVVAVLCAIALAISAQKPLNVQKITQEANDVVRARGDKATNDEVVKREQREILQHSKGLEEAKKNRKTIDTVLKSGNLDANTRKVLQSQSKRYQTSQEKNQQLLAQDHVQLAGAKKKGIELNGKVQKEERELVKVASGV